MQQPPAPLSLTGVCLHSLRFDSMHVVDCNGLAAHCLGNLFVEIIRDKQWGPLTKDEALSELNRRIKQYYNEYGVQRRMPPLSMGNLVDTSAETTSFPFLHGPGVKAANTKALLHFGRILAEELDDGGEARRRRFKTFRALVRFNEIIESQPMFLSGSAHQELCQCIHQFLLNYSWLGRNAAERGRVLWNVVPKHHYFAHFASQALLINPTAVRCYIDESFVGSICEVWSSSKAGPYHKKVQGTVLRKYLLALQLSFSDFC